MSQQNNRDCSCWSYRLVGTIVLSLGLTILVCCMSCREDGDRRSKGKKREESKPKGMELIGTKDVGSLSTSGDFLQAPGHDGFLYVWQWDRLTSEPQRMKVEGWYPRDFYDYPVVSLNKGSTLGCSSYLIEASHTDDTVSIIVRDMRQGRPLQSFSFEKSWACDQLRPTRDGKFVAVYLRELYKYVLGDNNRDDEGEHRFGVLECESGEIRWISSVYKADPINPQIIQVAIAEDGKYLVAVGVSGGGFIHVADIARQEVMWQKVPHGSEVPDGPWTVGFNDACFSPDSELIYVAGNVGLFCFDVQTGRILSQWPVAGRCIGVAASPDGRLVAGGAGGNGLVYIFDARTGSLRRTIGTGQHTIYGLTFSPDSTLLATSGVMRTGVKIWKMPADSYESSIEETPTKGTE